MKILFSISFLSDIFVDLIVNLLKADDMAVVHDLKSFDFGYFF